MRFFDWFDLSNFIDWHDFAGCVNHFMNWILKKPLQAVFWAYVLFLSFLLIIHNPFAYVPVDEELVEQGFGLSLSPHVLSFSVLAILGFAARFHHPWWMFFGLFLYAGGTELLQGALHPWLGRYCDIWDFWDNVQGLIYGGLAWSVVHYGFSWVKRAVGIA